MRRSTRIKSCVINLSLGSRVREIFKKKSFFFFLTWYMENHGLGLVFGLLNMVMKFLSEF